MAGMQSCFRKFLIFNSSRLINKNGIMLQSVRGRHCLVFHISSSKSRMVFQTSRLCNTKRDLLVRLASTNVTIMKEATSLVPKSERTEALQVNSGPGNVESSSSNVVIDENLLPPAPEPELVTPPDMEFVLMGLKEPSFESLGLGSMWPSGIVQQVYEYMHINLDLPWWQAIVAVTFVIRIALTPVVVRGRKDGIILMNNLPEMSKIQQKVTEAKVRGDYFAVASHTMELQNFIKEKKISLFSTARTALIQGPIFFSMYYALNGMAKVPVESLKTEGLFWFKDLTVPDPYYILPVVLSGTLFAVIEIGAEGNPAKSNTHVVKWFLRALPLAALLFTANCSSCIAWYWTVSNSITLIQVALLKVPAIKRVLNMPESIHAVPPKSSNKGFIEGFKEGLENSRIARQIQDRERMNMMSFQKAGVGPVPRTFKRNPVLDKAK